MSPFPAPPLTLSCGLHNAFEATLAPDSSLRNEALRWLDSGQGQPRDEVQYTNLIQNTRRGCATTRRLTVSFQAVARLHAWLWACTAKAMRLAMLRCAQFKLAEACWWRALSPHTRCRYSVAPFAVLTRCLTFQGENEIGCHA